MGYLDCRRLPWYYCCTPSSCLLYITTWLCSCYSFWSIVAV